MGSPTRIVHPQVAAIRANREHHKKEHAMSSSSSVGREAAKQHAERNWAAMLTSLKEYIEGNQPTNP